ncbi:MAG TPA: polymorphic toxin-type HINT domain-containing protein, partial [Nannocystaceae bacterium]|nr:polymorphic toxin-type HINT domain-containing protein [Nannocystaceae bacterium]
SASPSYQVSVAIPAGGRGECFVAGTLVTTHRGQVAIEKVKLGDMVLSKNIVTGALEFKPVLQTTIRPIEEVTSLRAGGNSFECTLGASTTSIDIRCSSAHPDARAATRAMRARADTRAHSSSPHPRAPSLIARASPSPIEDRAPSPAPSRPGHRPATGR